jgi:hypothetical protein
MSPQPDRPRARIGFDDLPDEVKVRLIGDLDLSAKQKHLFHDLPRHATIALRPKSLEIGTLQIAKLDSRLAHSRLGRIRYQRMKAEEAGRDVILNAIGKMMGLWDEEAS